VNASAVLIAQAVLVLLLGLWLLLAWIENLRHPRANRDLIAEVLSMRRVKQHYPAIHAEVGENAIESTVAHRLLFGLIIAAEIAISVALLAGAVLLAMAGFGRYDREAAGSIALLATAAFTLLWGGLLVGGQWLHIWAGAEGLQQTFFFLTLWGVGTLAVLV
jgi:predicted small integral membrane protein